jgi:hypothetical protein
MNQSTIIVIQPIEQPICITDSKTIVYQVPVSAIPTSPSITPILENNSISKNRVRRKESINNDLLCINVCCLCIYCIDGISKCFMCTKNIDCNSCINCINIEPIMNCVSFSTEFICKGVCCIFDIFRVCK